MAVYLSTSRPDCFSKSEIDASLMEFEAKFREGLKQKFEMIGKQRHCTALSEKMIGIQYGATKERILYLLATGDFRELTANSIFKKCDSSFPGNFKDIGMNKYMIISASEGPLATSGVGTCFAICLRGKTLGGDVLLGLCHTGHDLPLEETLSFLQQKMLELGVVQSNLEFFIIGGQIKCEDPDASVADIEEEAFNLRTSFNINLRTSFNIRGLRFNLTQNSDSLDVVFDGENIFYSTESIFSPQELFQADGEDLPTSLSDS